MNRDCYRIRDSLQLESETAKTMSLGTLLDDRSLRVARLVPTF